MIDVPFGFCREKIKRRSEDENRRWKLGNEYMKREVAGGNEFKMKRNGEENAPQFLAGISSSL
jgi:hypothetical protein